MTSTTKPSKYLRSSRNIEDSVAAAERTIVSTFRSMFNLALRRTLRINPLMTMDHFAEHAGMSTEDYIELFRQQNPSLHDIARMLHGLDMTMMTKLEPITDEINYGAKADDEDKGATFRWQEVDKQDTAEAPEVGEKSETTSAEVPATDPEREALSEMLAGVLNLYLTMKPGKNRKKLQALIVNYNRKCCGGLPE